MKNNLRSEIKVKGIYRLFENGVLIREEKNLVLNAGFDILLKNLAGTQSGSETLKFQYIGVGTGSTPVVSTDSVLETEIERNPVDLFTISTNSITGKTDFSSSDAVGTLTELGVFITTTATSTTDSGVLFSRVVLSVPYVKTSSKTLTVEYQLVLSN
jgi:hypothetical protein